jgi:hypothetical protein
VEEEDFVASANAKMMELDDENENTIPKIIPENAMIDEEEVGTKSVTPKI